MSFSDFAAIGGFLSSLAVCGSLVYLALQVRQSDRNQRSLMTQGITTRGADIVMFLAQPHMSVLLARMTVGETDFSPSEIVQLNLALRLVIIDLQDGYVQRKVGLTDALSLDSLMHIAKLFLSYPVMRVAWLGARPTFSSEVVRIVDDMIRNLPLSEPVDLVARLKDGLTAIPSPVERPGSNAQ